MRYNKKEEKSDKDYYSLRDIVEDITGIDQNNDAFESKYKEVQRIIGTFRKTLGQTGSKMKIASSEKDMIVEATKNFYNNYSARDIILKLNREEELTIEEYDVLINIFSNAIIKYSLDEEVEAFKKYIEDSKGEEFFNKAEEIKKEVIQDINLINDVKHYQTKLQYLYEYEKIINDSLEELRSKINMHVIYEKAYEGAIEKQPKFLSNEPLTYNNMSQELLKCIINEIKLMD